MRKGGGGLGMFTQAGLFNKEDASIFLLIHIWGFGNYMEAVWLWPLEVAVQVVSMVVCFKALPPSLSLSPYVLIFAASHRRPNELLPKKWLHVGPPRYAR